MWLSRDHDASTQREQPHLGCFPEKGAIIIHRILLGPLGSIEILEDRDSSYRNCAYELALQAIIYLNN